MTYHSNGNGKPLKLKVAAGQRMSAAAFRRLAQNAASQGVNASASDKLSAKPKKTQRRAKKEEIRDVFTTICKTDLGVVCVKEYQFHPKRKWRFDYAIPEHKIALEVEGGVWTYGRHTRPQGFLGDIEKYNTATLMGWRVFRTTPEELYCMATVKMLKNAISGAFCGQND